MAVVQELLYNTDNGRLLRVMLMRGKRKRKERGCLLNRRIMDVQPTVSVCCGRVCSVFSLAGWVVIQQLTIAKERHKVEHKSITSKGVRQSSPPEILNILVDRCELVSR